MGEDRAAGGTAAAMRAERQRREDGLREKAQERQACMEVGEMGLTLLILFHQALWELDA